MRPVLEIHRKYFGHFSSSVSQVAQALSLVNHDVQNSLSPAVWRSERGMKGDRVWRFSMDEVWVVGPDVGLSTALFSFVHISGKCTETYIWQQNFPWLLLKMPPRWCMNSFSKNAMSFSYFSPISLAQPAEIVKTDGKKQLYNHVLCLWEKTKMKCITSMAGSSLNFLEVQLQTVNSSFKNQAKLKIWWWLKQYRFQMLPPNPLCTRSLKTTVDYNSVAAVLSIFYISKIISLPLIYWWRPVTIYHQLYFPFIIYGCTASLFSAIWVRLLYSCWLSFIKRA